METISLNETAKRIRQALKAKFPAVKFSVRSKSYSGGASIDIRWTDGPTQKAVDEIAKNFEGATFDASQDLKSYKTSTIENADGSKSMVRYGADYVFTSRVVSDFDRKEAEILALIKARCVLDGGKFGGDWIDNVARRIVYASEANEAMEAAFNRLISGGYRG